MGADSREPTTMLNRVESVVNTVSSVGLANECLGVSRRSHAPNYAIFYRTEFDRLHRIVGLLVRQNPAELKK